MAEEERRKRSRILTLSVVTVLAFSAGRLSAPPTARGELERDLDGSICLSAVHEPKSSRGDVYETGAFYVRLDGELAKVCRKE